MAWVIESTRPARAPSQKHPHRKTEKITEYADSYTELSRIVGWQSVDADRVVIKKTVLTPAIIEIVNRKRQEDREAKLSTKKYNKTKRSHKKKEG